MTNHSLSNEEVDRLKTKAKSYLVQRWEPRPGFKPLILVKGKGIHFWDVDGKHYIDFISQLYNVNLGLDNQTIIEAAKKAHAYEFIQALPKKFDTVIGDRGFRLSGGEKQRISIARAMLKDAPILILDEATSHLDSAAEQLVKEAFYTLMRNTNSLFNWQGRTKCCILHLWRFIRCNCCFGLYSIICKP